MARPRIQADLPDEVRRGLLIAAAEKDISIGKLIEQMGREMYPEYIERARKLIAAEPQAKPKPRPSKKPG